jgi:arylsulfatase A-like enzyme
MHSLMSSMPVREHGGGLPTSVGKSRRINESIPIAYMLQRAGYETTAIVSNPLLSPEHGFADGFDHWLHTDDSVEPMLLLNVYNRIRARLSGSTGEIDHGRDARVVRRAIEVMGAPSNRPRFVWVHLVTPQNYATDPVIDIPGWTKGTTDEDLLKMSYVASIDMTRRYLLRLNAAARSWIVVVTADHGESMGEGGVWGHGTGLNDAELRVPLAIRRPNTQGGVVTRQVSTADVGHTLLSVTGDARGFPGKNLLKRRQTPVEVGGVENDGSMFAARMASGKYIPRKPGTVGPGVMLSDQSQVHLKASGYLD